MASFHSYGQGLPPGSGTARPPRLPVGFVVALVVFTVVGVLADLLFSFAMLFAGDSCGTGGTGGSSPVCDARVWLILLGLPWLGLVAATLVALLGAMCAVRQRRSPWYMLLLGVAVYLVACAVTYQVLFG
jgi:hypothetical protein